MKKDRMSNSLAGLPLEDLPSDVIERLMDNPVFMQDIVERSSKSEALTTIVDEIMDRQFEAMSPEEKQWVNRLIEEVKAALKK